MLLRFRVANVRSLRDEQELSFVAPGDSQVPSPRTAAVPPAVLQKGHRAGTPSRLPRPSLPDRT
jgi:hypothetical protein